MKQKREVVILAVLIAIAGIVWYFERTQPALGPGTVALAENPQLLSVENPQLHHENLNRARQTEYKSAGRNIFSTVAPPPSRPQMPHVTQTHEASGPKQPPPLPPPPPLTLPAKFFGYGTVPNNSIRRAFLLAPDGEDVYIVPEGEVLLNRFRILKVGNASLEFEELSSGRRGTAPLEEQAAAGPAA
jgi:hypothetical protein